MEITNVFNDKVVEQLIEYYLGIKQRFNDETNTKIIEGINNIQTISFGNTNYFDGKDLVYNKNPDIVLLFNTFYSKLFKDNALKFFYMLLMGVLYAHDIKEEELVVNKYEGNGILYLYTWKDKFAKYEDLLNRLKVLYEKTTRNDFFGSYYDVDFYDKYECLLLDDEKVYLNKFIISLTKHNKAIEEDKKMKSSRYFYYAFNNLMNMEKIRKVNVGSYYQEADEGFVKQTKRSK